ncbi:hypothetical protein JMUB3935_2477 [Leptotrichia trevisanii]|uniref:Uncharacterized protein n=1 Tax=Leptotrichia trevisanii TaxID=109328 RepID=A0A510KP39_9FUSO|nr:hypothetical protein [Leptotrichia trevisanii]BBM46234.1 hypothetical protein JMUB3870_2371 [Leptotrichia trevisanii]BBM53480.1 hypothetical protein JMUB3935_2477 [Leptotrichia trevisanii]
MNIKNFMKKLILILGIIGISVTSFAATRRNSRVVYVKREPRRRVIRRRYIFIRVPRRKKVVYVKREPSRRQRRVRIAAGRRRAARRR